MLTKETFYDTLHLAKEHWRYLMNERRTKLVEYVSIHGRTEVETLANHFQTSKVTIRKDLEYLSTKGILKRERGYAILNTPNDINYNLAFHYETKLKIARQAAQYVNDGETVMVESGSTCAIFAEELVKTKKNVTLITNSMHIANFIKEYPNVNIVLLGGTLQSNSQALVGPLTIQSAKAFHVDKIFVGTDGYSRTLGFTGDDITRSDTLNNMILSADKVFVLTESQKFDSIGSVSFLSLDKVYEVITDDKICKNEALFLETQNIIVTLVP